MTWHSIFLNANFLSGNILQSSTLCSSIRIALFNGLVSYHQALSKKLKSETSVEEIFRKAQTAFNHWSKLEPKKRMAAAILQALDFDFFELLDSVTIARSRRHIATFYDTSDIGKFPKRRKPISHHCALTDRRCNGNRWWQCPHLKKQQHCLSQTSITAPLGWGHRTRRCKDWHFNYWPGP